MDTIKGTLPHGVMVAGVLHKDFEMRPAVIGDTIDAIDELGGGQNTIKVSLHVVRRQMLKLGTLEAKDITLELLRGLNVEDWNTLDQASVSIAKKAEPPKND